MYIVSYDISSDRLRSKVSKTLEGYGVRVQYSVFECRLNEKHFREMYEDLMELTREMAEGSIRFYELCGKCEKKIITVGTINPKVKQMREEIVVI